MEPDISAVTRTSLNTFGQIHKRRQKPKNLDELWAITQEEWYAIPEQIEVLYDSVPRRIDALVDAKGWYTKY